MKKIFSVLILAAFIVGALSVTATAADGDKITVNLIYVDVTAPVDGAAPDNTARTKSVAYAVYDYSDGAFQNGVIWEEEFDDDLDLGWTTFEEGKKYYVGVLIKLTAGYEVKSDENGNPSVKGEINGKSAEVSWFTELGDDDVLMLKYTFVASVNKDKQISKVALIVPPPASGRAPSFVAYTDSEHFTIEEVVWHDATKGERLDENDIFLGGHEYTAYVTIKSDEGYIFLIDEDGLPIFVPTVNGIAANVRNYGVEKDGKTVVVSYEFPMIEEETTEEQTTAVTEETTAEATEPTTSEVTTAEVVSTTEATTEPTSTTSVIETSITAESLSTASTQTTTKSSSAVDIIVDPNAKSGCGSTIGAGAAIAAAFAVLVSAVVIKKKN